MSDADLNSDEPRSRPSQDPGRTSGFRRLIDSLVCLALAVIVFRTFEVEGYMISTGSMAPSLLGFHKRVVCPTCEFEFAVGVAYDDDSEQSGADFDADDRGFALCPNCGQGQIDVSRVPRNQGDQLLVHKNAFQFYAPRRWEVVVFRNPYKPTQAYVKRIVGLPFETVEIRDGDVYIDGVIQRKDLTSQRAVRINVYDHSHEPRIDPRWERRWVAEPVGGAGGTRLRDGSGGSFGPARQAGPTSRQVGPAWQADGAAFVLRGSAGSASAELADEEQFHWMVYRHWIRSGGTHETSVVLPGRGRELEESTALLPLRYDPETGRLSCVGVLHDGTRDQLLAVADNPRLRTAIQQLAAESHFAPITDDYGYNRTRNGVPAVPIRDLMLSLNLTVAAGNGRFAIEMTDGERRCRLLLDTGRGVAELHVDGVDGAVEPVRTAALPLLTGRTALVEMSLFDRQVLVALDGEPLFAPWTLPDGTERDSAGIDRALRQPVRFGATGLDVRVDSIKLYRDVHYTPKGDPAPVRLRDDEYYVLGDNSPVSLDSRRWEQPAVPRRLFLGKPFVVHLPSKQVLVRIGATTRHIRVPDFTRIRYIR